MSKELTFNKYQELGRLTDIHPPARRLEACVLGLAAEAGEVAGKLSKQIRGDRLDHQPMASELGDVLWYLAMVADALGYELADIAQHNLYKLADRDRRGVIKGDGDNR